jgi:hypothetical protein
VNRFLESEADICELRLAGATIAMVRIANHYVELSLVLLNTSATAEIRIESDCTVADSDGKSSTLLPGPDLGRILLTLLDADVSAIRAQGLDLILEFTTGYGCKCIPSRLATSRIAFLLAVT